MAVLFLLLALLLILWISEAWKLRRALSAVPIRIHVNGSRGKSSVTRLVAAGLRESGLRTVAKTTGSKARYIHPDGREEPVIRLGTPNIIEQVGVLDRARRDRAEAIVMECMAIRPDLQAITEDRILHSSIGVITNVRADHLDVMGPTVADAAMAISSTIPRGGTIVLGPTRNVSELREVAFERKSTVHMADVDRLPEGAMDGFGFIEHEENVAATLAVTRTLRIEDDIALRGMYKVTPDVGACTRWNILHQGRSIEFLNIFAANDLESTISIWNRLGLGEEPSAITVALLNLRGDRLDRSLQFAEAVESGFSADYYMLVGDISSSVLRKFEGQIPAKRLVTLGKVRPAEIFDRVADLGERPARVGGIGNIGGLGHEILQYVAGRGEGG